MATLGAVCIGIYFVATSAYQERLGTLRVVAWTYPSAACAVWVGLAVSGGERGMRPVGVEPWLAVAALAIVPQLVGHTALNWSLKHFSAGAVGAATLLEPVFAGALAWALLGESLTPVQLLGAVVLLTGVGWALATGRRAPQGPALRRERDG
jgi:drug/metabolite transporter (DMT)-like permease